MAPIDLVDENNADKSSQHLLAITSQSKPLSAYNKENNNNVKFSPLNEHVMQSFIQQDYNATKNGLTNEETSNLCEQLTLESATSSENHLIDYGNVSSSPVSTASLSPMSDINNSTNGQEGAVKQVEGDTDKPKSPQLNEELSNQVPPPPSSLALRTNLNTAGFQVNNGKKSAKSSPSTNEKGARSAFTPSPAHHIPSYLNPANYSQIQGYNNNSFAYNHHLHQQQQPHHGLLVPPPHAVHVAPMLECATPAPTLSSTIVVHVDVGHVFQVQLGDEFREIIGPATVKMVSNDGIQPIPIQLMTPAPGQLVQQITDEHGIVHLILSSQQPAQSPLNLPPNVYDANLNEGSAPAASHVIASELEYSNAINQNTEDLKAAPPNSQHLLLVSLLSLFMK